MAIHIYDDLNPEAMAMLQALYSRSSNSVTEHRKKVETSGSAKFMQSYYVGYGHASIGDCGTTTLFIEGISLLAAKAIQDNPLYSGQESSTRYINFNHQTLIDPIGNQVSYAILNQWMNLYFQVFEQSKAYLTQIHPTPKHQDSQLWAKTLQARAFDIARGFLPLGITTQLSWATNLRQANDKLQLLLIHPLEEIREIAKQCLKQLKQHYPSSFSHHDYPEQTQYYQNHAQALHYQTGLNLSQTFQYQSDLDVNNIQPLSLLQQRPEKTNLPKLLSRYGQFYCQFLLDYGSFRDIQRHRNGLCRIPIIDKRYGFHPWYLQQLPDERHKSIETAIAQQLQQIQQLQQKYQVNEVAMQYYYPLGMQVACEVVYDLPQMVYVTELRSGSTVHPTLRQIAHQMHQALVDTVPDLKLYTDLSEDRLDIKRGLQDIVERTPS